MVAEQTEGEKVTCPLSYMIESQRFRPTTGPSLPFIQHHDLCTFLITLFISSRERFARSESRTGDAHTYWRSNKSFGVRRPGSASRPSVIQLLRREILQFGRQAPNIQASANSDHNFWSSLPPRAMKFSFALRCEWVTPRTCNPSVRVTKD